MAIKLDNATPGLFGIIFGVGLSVSLGALLAVLHLISRPVEIVRTVPKEPTEGVRYVIEGATGSSAGNRWKIKVKRLVEKIPGEYAFTDAEINAWAEGTFEKAEPPAGETPSFALLAGVPNFHAGADRLHIVTSNDLLLLGGVSKLVIEANGSFKQEAEGWSFVPAEFYLGGLPAHKLPVLAGVLFDRFSKAQAVPADASSILRSASSISVAEGSLAVHMP